ncbi:hypothetical protein [Streptomyces sp. NPDC012888]|uniref:hypothetical protein n=1 Tax=Streptomyces sp. NPDC012888 TaxID=3364855 RepID=UPI003684AF7A
MQSQVYLTDPQLATSGTELTRRLNTKLMARVNSGPGPLLGLFTANGPNVYPGGTPLPYLAAAFPAGGPDTPGNATLRATLRLFADPGTTPPPNADFDDATLAFVDENQGLTPAEIPQAGRPRRTSGTFGHAAVPVHRGPGMVRDRKPRAGGTALLRTAIEPPPNDQDLSGSP